MVKGLASHQTRSAGSAAVLPSGGVRILLDYRSALRNRTGVGEFTHNMAAALVEAGRPSDQVALFSSSWKDRLAPSSVPGSQIIDRHIPVSALNLAWHRLGWPSVESLAGPCDVAWSLHPLLMPSRAAAQVITIYDLYFLDRPDHSSREIRRDYATLALRHAARADAIIVISEYTKAQVMSRLNVPEQKITVCVPGAPGWSPRETPAEPGPILYVGTAEPRKNLATLVKSYLQLLRRDAATPPLVLAGRSDGLDLDLASDQSGLAQSHIKVLGYVSAEEKLRLYRDASMLVIPSLDEGFGMTAVEAMSLGVPVIASNRGALPEIVGDAALLVDPTDHEGLATAMERVLREPSLRGTLERRGIERAQAFSWASAAAAARGAFDAAVRRRRTRH
jgi:glycosyltransferase involved in cell wall biosynthesis